MSVSRALDGGGSTDCVSGVRALLGFCSSFDEQSAQIRQSACLCTIISVLEAHVDSNSMYHLHEFPLRRRAIPGTMQSPPILLVITLAVAYSRKHGASNGSVTLLVQWN